MINTNWEKEIEKYIPRLETLLDSRKYSVVWPESIPSAPWDHEPTPQQAYLYTASSFFVTGCWSRSCENINAIILLMNNGYLSQVGALSRLLFEVRGASHYLFEELEKFKKTNNIDRLGKAVNKLYHGARSEVLMPWGDPASQEPIHIMDLIRSLNSTLPNAEEVYSYLCESAHPNNPRYLEWWHIGKHGDNWTNQTVQKRGHELLEKNTKIIEDSFSDINDNVANGLMLCGHLFQYA